MIKWDIMTALDVCVDLILTGDTTPVFGQTEKLIDDYDALMGGSCAIFAAQCAKLGMRTLGVGVRGADNFGELFERELRRGGVDVSALRIDPAVKTGLGLALMRENDRAILTYAGSIDALRAEDVSVSLLSQCRHLHIGSYYLMKRLRPAWPSIARQAKQMGLTVSLDTNWDPAGVFDALDALLPFVDVLLPNKQELQAMGGLDRMRSLVPLLIVKDGHHGASAYTRDGKTFHQAAFPVSMVDAIGAGDSFDAGFITSWLSGYDVPHCLSVACACGGLSGRARGGTAGQGTWQDIKHLVNLAD